MIIKTKKELIYSIKVDRIINGYPVRKTLKERIAVVFMGPGIIEYLEYMRKLSYYSYRYNTPPHQGIWSVPYLYYRIKFEKLGKKLGFSINYNSFGYGLVLPHYGTVVVGKCNIGNFALIHTSTCITARNHQIGEGLVLSTGAKIIKQVELGDYVQVGPNSVVNSSFKKGSCTIVGAPAHYAKDASPWFEVDKMSEIMRTINNIKIEQ